MTTHILSSKITRLLFGAASLLAATGCGGELLRSGRSPVYLVVESTEGSQGGGAGTSGVFLLSDVEVLVEETINGQTVKVPTYFNDNATVTLRADLKNPSIEGTAVNTVTITRYHVDFRRSDGRNTPGVDVPFGIDGGLGVSIPAGSSQAISFEIVRHQAKLEPPLRNLRSFGGQGFISTIAEITFYGRDQNGNEVTATALMDVQFGDFADEQ